MNAYVYHAILTRKSLIIFRNLYNVKKIRLNLRLQMNFWVVISEYVIYDNIFNISNSFYPCISIDVILLENIIGLKYEILYMLFSYK